MHCFSAILFLLLAMFGSSMEMEVFNYTSISNDVAKFNKTCSIEYCLNSEKDSLVYQSCHCGVHCVQFGTCCFDSPYAAIPQPKQKPACRSVDEGENYFIVDQHSSSDSVWANLCNTEWDGAKDLQKTVPVTSLFTTITYKNYYCFRSYETTDDFLYWNVELGSDSATYTASDVKDKQVSLTYDNDTETWMASYDGGITSFDVRLSVTIPHEIWGLMHKCVPHVISDCAGNWTDDDVRSKCHSYMGIKAIKNNYVSVYKNIHCALCNHEKLEDVICRSFATNAFGKYPFSFTYLLDINRSDGELVGKIQKCSEDHLWDPYTRKCRKLTCALPGFSVKSGKCVPE